MTRAGGCRLSLFDAARRPSLFDAARRATARPPSGRLRLRRLLPAARLPISRSARPATLRVAFLVVHRPRR